MKRITVYADFDFLSAAQEIGTLGYEHIRGKDHFVFGYSHEWLKQYGGILLSGDLMNVPSLQHPRGDDGVFGYDCLSEFCWGDNGAYGNQRGDQSGYEAKFIELADPVSEFNLFGYRLTAFKVNHRITCYGYSINIDRAGKFDPEKAEKNNVPMKAWSRLQKGQVVEIDGVTYTQDMILGPERKGIKVTYCTDTRPVKIISEMAAGSDIFICEGMYGVDDKDNKAVEHKHMTFNEAARLAAAADPAPKEMWLTHYSPSMVNPAEYIGNLKKIFPNSIAAKDLRTVTLNFIEEAE